MRMFFHEIRPFRVQTFNPAQAQIPVSSVHVANHEGLLALAELGGDFLSGKVGGGHVSLEEVAGIEPASLAIPLLIE